MPIPAHLLTYLIFLPLVGAVVCLMTPNLRAVKTIAIVTSGVTLLLSLLLFIPYFTGDGAANASIFGDAYGEMLGGGDQVDWITIGQAEIQYYVGVDGLSFPLVILTTLVTFLSCLASWNIESWKISRGSAATSPCSCCSRRG